MSVRKSKSVYYKDLLKENSKDPENVWKTVKSIFPIKARDKQNLQSFSIDGVKVPKKIANACCSFFTGVASTLKEKVIPLSNFTWRKPKKIPIKTDQNFKFQRITRLEVLRQ